MCGLMNDAVGLDTASQLHRQKNTRWMTLARYRDSLQGFPLRLSICCMLYREAT